MKYAAFGEIMLRLSPPGYGRFLQENKFDTCFGGSEANVLLSLSAFGNETKYITKLPENEIADACIRELKGFGVDTSGIARGGERMGIYFLEKGASLRPGKVIYDRANSSVSKASPEDFDWDELLDGADWFHYTGITPALGDNVAAILLDALKAAKSKGIKVSCDLNYRSKLWSKEKAREVMTALMPYTDVLIANDGSLNDVFGIRSGDEYVYGEKLENDGYINIAKQAAEKFGFECVALTYRESMSASDNNYAGMLYKDGKAYFSSIFPVHIVDRVGGGDSFAAGLLHALGKYSDYNDVIGFAAAAGALKHTVEGDFNRVTENEVLSVMKGNTNGLVRR